MPALENSLQAASYKQQAVSYKQQAIIQNHVLVVLGIVAKLICTT